MKNLIFVKLGGSVITDKTKPYTVNFPVLRRLCREIVKARKDNKKLQIIVGHGGGSFPHTSAKKYKTHQGLINKKSVFGFSLVGNDAAKLNRIVVEEFLNLGENAFTVKPSCNAIAKNDRIITWNVKPIEHLLKIGVLPVTYGDVGIDVEKGCCILSTEEIFRYLAKKFTPRKIIFVSKHAVCDSDPEKNPKAKIIKKITKENFEKIKKTLSGSHGVDVTGGMLKKVEKALEIAKYANEVEIISPKQGNLLKSINGKNMGTLIRW
jgi:isopentenyl phosphate kinase